MTENQYWNIDENILKTAYEEAWSMESMEAHGAKDRTVKYIGSVCKGEIITDYYKDTADCYWYKTRGIRNGKIVSMDEYIYGCKIIRKRKKSWHP